jgi:two-component system nitrate/nitrite sensor histidine kinase NarX
VHFQTCDNGIGFDTSASKHTSMGMRIMRERADTIGAHLRITSKPGAGTCVEMKWHKPRNKERE